MHREFDPAVNPFTRPPAAGLYLLTGLSVGLFLLDIATPILNGLQSLGLDVSASVPRSVYGFRFALLAAILGGSRSLYSSLDKLLEGKLGADLAIVLAAAGAILLGEPVVAAEVVVIGLIGECLEAFTFDRAQGSMRKLTELFPLRCWRLRADGTEERIFTTEIQIGDQIIVRPGGKIPADGVVVSGEAALDTAALTGESAPREASVGSAVLAGMIVPVGSLTMRVEKTASDTVAGQVVELTAKALASKGQGERLADRLARWFLPIVLGLTLLTFVYNLVLFQFGLGRESGPVSLSAAARLAMYPSLAVLVVACPCPLVLATPAAIVAALGRLAGTGVLVKRASALERLAQLKAFAFDKTGTLTKAKLEVVSIHSAPHVHDADLLRFAASAERLSEHPIARAVLRAAEQRGLASDTVETLDATPGAGIRATTSTGSTLLVGKPEWLSRCGVRLPEIPNEDGLTKIAVAQDGNYLGWLGLQDELRPEAVGIVSELASLGFAPLAVLSGDNPEAVRGTLGNVPGLELHGGLLPDDKAAWLRQQTQPTGYLGDGINDAPALAQADVGIAVGSGADLAAEAGDLVFLGEPLKNLPFLIRLSREAVRIIRFNIIGFGFVLNLIGVILTGWLWPLLGSTGVWLEQAPLAGAIFHQFGSLLVLLNSMRLLSFERVQESTTWKRWAGVLRAADRRLASFDFDEFIHEASHHRRAITAGVAVVVVLGWLASGVLIVQPTEVVVVQRFGALASERGPGLHYLRPWPFETSTRFQPEEVRTVEIGFRLLPEERAASLGIARQEQAKLRADANLNTGLTWGAAHSGAIVPMVDESLLITGDGDLVELFATVRYRIADPSRYLAAGHPPEGMLRSLAESTFREQAGAMPFQDLLTSRRTEFEAKSYQQLLSRYTEAVPGGAGVQLLGLTVHDLHPPQEVVAAFHAVAEAIQRRDQEINLAEAARQRRLRQARENATVLLNQTEAENREKLEQATATRDVFLAWARSRQELPQSVETEFYTERERRRAAGEAVDKIDEDLKARRVKLIEARRNLTEFRLMLDTVTLVLQGRNKILLDVDQLPGKRHILLMDPDGPTPKLPPIAFPRADLSPVPPQAPR